MMTKRERFDNYLKDMQSIINLLGDLERDLESKEITREGAARETQNIKQTLMVLGIMIGLETVEGE